MPKLVGVEDLAAESRAHAAMLPIEFRQSYPVPFFEDRTFRIGFLYCLQVLGPGPSRLRAPAYLSLVDPVEGAFITLRAVTPGDVGQPNTAGFIGTFALPDGMTSEEYIALRAELYRAYDAVLPHYAVKSHGGRDELRASAARFGDLFRRLHEPPLLPYYHHLGRDFFDWLARTTHGDE